MTRRSGVVGLLGLSMSGPSCGGMKCDPLEPGFASITVTVTDPDGAPIPDAVVTYEVDSSGVGDCVSVGAGVFECGLEQQGTFAIDVTHPDFRPGQGGAFIERDETGCHIAPQQVAITLCDPGALPSVIATVYGGTLPVDADAVTYANGELTAEPCVHGGTGTYACGFDRSGTFEITARSAAYGDGSATVDVPMGECHVVTQDVEIDLVAP